MKRYLIIIYLLSMQACPAQPSAVFQDLKNSAATNTLTEDKFNELLHKEKLSCNQLGEAVIAAAQKGHIEPIRLLITYNANIHLKDEAALRAAGKQGFADIVQLLLEHGANVHIKSNWALIEAFDENKITVVKTLLDWSRKPRVKAFSLKQIKDLRDEAQEEPREEEMLKLFDDYLDYLKNIEVHR